MIVWRKAYFDIVEINALGSDEAGQSGKNDSTPHFIRVCMYQVQGNERRLRSLGCLNALGVVC